MSAAADGLQPGTVTDAAALAMAHEPVPAEQAVAGAPSTAFVELTDAIGIWELAPGAMRDVEDDPPGSQADRPDVGKPVSSSRG